MTSLVGEGKLAGQERPGNSRGTSVFPGMDGEDRNDSREVLTRTSHTTGEEITSGVLCMA